MRSCLNDRQGASLQTLEILQQRLQANQCNAELIGVDPASPQLRAARETLERRASFLLVMPVLADVQRAIGALHESVTVGLPATDRQILTTQLTGLRKVIDHNNANALADARRGARFCSLSVRPEVFAEFLRDQKACLEAVVGACRMHRGQPRTQALTTALLELSRAYLARAKMMPSGMVPAASFVFDDRRFGPEPVSVALLQRPQSQSTLFENFDGQCADILIGIDDLDNAQVEPAHGTGTSQMHVKGFERCDVASQQAGVFLQKLFLELAHVEEKIYLCRRMNKDGSALTACARNTRREIEYLGSVRLGDRRDALHADGPDPEGRSQRALFLQLMPVIALIGAEYRRNQGEPIVVDADLASWLGSPEVIKDMTGLQYPARRLQLGPMLEIAGLLLKTGVFVETGGAPASAQPVTADLTGSPLPDLPAPRD
ncbi:MAG: hypothetical protein H7327_05960 [Herminiimonas sp.]|nr:hypothetical protein [Herminiimonas sp.]